MVPQKAELPAVAYLEISDLPLQSMDGPNDLTELNIEFKVWANSYKEARQAGKMIEKILDDSKGTFDGVVIQASTLTNDTKDFEEDPETSIKRYAAASEFQIWYEDN